MFGRGRPREDRSRVGEPRGLTVEDLASFQRAELPAAQKFRESYHAVARAAALGLRPAEIALQTGYGQGRINQLLADPTMQARIEAYRELAVDPAFAREADEYMSLMVHNRNIAERLLHDKLTSAEPEDISYRDLVNISASRQDRTGYGKVSTAKVEVDLADRLAQALAASAKTIEGRAMKIIEQAKEEAA